jgi:hypothetical protein
MTHEANQRVYLSHEEIVTMDLDELKAHFLKAKLHMSSMQLKLVEGVLEGLSEQKAAEQAGYSLKTSNKSWRAMKTKKVQHALAIGREIAQRGAGTTPEWVRTQLKSLYEKARKDDDKQAATKCLQELCRIDGHYAAEAMKLMHSAHDGGPLEREVSEDEWNMLSHLYHNIRDDDEDTVH